MAKKKKPKPKSKKSAAKKEGKKEAKKHVKEIEKAMFALKFYPVAVNEDSKNEAVRKLIKIYNEGNDTIRQLLLYMIHDTLASSFELKIMHTFDFFRMKKPNLEPTQLRMNVYRAMFNYNTSLEGIVEIISILGRLDSGDEASKLLTYHFSRFATVENEASQIIRNAIIDALGESDSHYALNVLLDYVKYSENERTIGRATSALLRWDEKIDTLKISKSEKERLRKRLQEIMTRELKGSHYG